LHLFYIETGAFPDELLKQAGACKGKARLPAGRHNRVRKGGAVFLFLFTLYTILYSQGNVLALSVNNYKGGC
jgi:hypothetical protein